MGNLFPMKNMNVMILLGGLLVKKRHFTQIDENYVTSGLSKT